MSRLIIVTIGYTTVYMHLLFHHFSPSLSLSLSLSHSLSLTLSLSLSLFLVEDILKKGHVPPPPQYYIRRTELIRSIRKELRKLMNTDSWVLLSGLPGYGENEYM